MRRTHQRPLAPPERTIQSLPKAWPCLSDTDESEVPVGIIVYRTSVSDARRPLTPLSVSQTHSPPRRHRHRASAG